MNDRKLHPTHRHAKLRPCPHCGVETRAHRTDDEKDGVYAAHKSVTKATRYRLNTHYSQGVKCPGSGAILGPIKHFMELDEDGGRTA